MKVKEFNERYYFHDSSLDIVSYDKESHTVTMIIDFCFWMQEGFKKGEPENGKLKVVFNNVKQYDGPVGENESRDILDGEIKDGKYHFLIKDYSESLQDADVYDIYIDATDVAVEDLRGE